MPFFHINLLKKHDKNTSNSFLLRFTPFSLKPTMNSSLSTFESPLNESNSLKVLPNDLIVFEPLASKASLTFCKTIYF